MRKLVARTSSLATRGAVYEVEDGLEVESADHYEVARQRVLFVDILMVTLHRSVGWVFVLVNAGIFAFFAMMAVVFINLMPQLGEGKWVAAGVYGAFGAPFLLAALLRLAFRVDEVTVWGRRSHASVRYTFRKGKARRLFEELTEKVRVAQEQLRTQYAAEAPAPVAAPLDAGGDAPPMPPPLPPE